MTWYEEQARLAAEPSEWSRAGVAGRIGLALSWAVKALLLFVLIGGTFGAIAAQVIQSATS